MYMDTIVYLYVGGHMHVVTMYPHMIIKSPDGLGDVKMGLIPDP